MDCFTHLILQTTAVPIKAGNIMLQLQNTFPSWWLNSTVALFVHSKSAAGESVSPKLLLSTRCFSKYIICNIYITKLFIHKIKICDYTYFSETLHFFFFFGYSGCFPSFAKMNSIVVLRINKQTNSKIHAYTLGNSPIINSYI